MKRQEEERLELERYKMAGINPDSFAEAGVEYNAKEMAREGVSSKDAYSVPASPSINEKWESAAALGAGAVGVGAGAAAANGMRSPMPLLRDGAQSPRIASPGPNNTRGPYAGAGYSPVNNPHGDMRSPGTMSPMRTASPGMPPSGPLPNPAQRSFSSPNAQMRVGSPGPQQGGYGGVGRVNSPGPMGAPAPQRSYTNPRPPPMGGYGGQSGGNGDYWR